MTSPIRPKVSKAIKQIAASDVEGKSKTKIDTKKEYEKLKDYLSGNYDELNQTEKERIEVLLDKASSYNDKTEENESSVSEKEKYSSTENSKDAPIGDTAQAADTQESNTNNAGSDTPAGDTTQADNAHESNTNNAPRGEKVIVDGKLCIKMPSGALSDAMTRRKIH